MLKQRVITALVLLAILLPALFWPTVVIAGLMFTILALYPFIESFVTGDSVATAIRNGQVDRGVIVCGSGAGTRAARTRRSSRAARGCCRPSFTAASIRRGALSLSFPYMSSPTMGVPRSLR